jgi:radical SAM superfamily enzyme YgiQ (UPF0313 family)
MRALLISTYELGRQPFGLASPAAWLRKAGVEVACFDLSREAFREELAAEADLVAFYLPMHTATRLAVPLIRSVCELNPGAHICCYGLYAPMNEDFLRAQGVQTILGGEFEQGLLDLATRLKHHGFPPSAPRGEPVVSLARQNFLTPDRQGLPALAQYARLMRPDGTQGVVGYTEASRGCKHLCRHCPVVPVYRGVFRIVSRDVVLDDVRQQAEAGAEHISFGDPDFFNGIGHAIPLVEEFHRRFPRLTYDVTIKIEHLLRHAEHLATLRRTGCLFVTSAVESVDDEILERLAKGHTRADFLRVVAAFHEAGLALQLTFVPFTPWTTLEGFLDLLDVLEAAGLAEGVAPIQLAIRLLIPRGSYLLESSGLANFILPFDDAALVYPWRHTDPRVDQLAKTVSKIVQFGEKLHLSRAQIFQNVRGAAREAAGLAPLVVAASTPTMRRAAVPYMNEPWYCCAEPAEDQLVPLARLAESRPSAEGFV